jgi:protein-arginine kinase activator protein McsA
LKRKIKAVKLAGGKCSRCGYDKYYGALHFHHLDPSIKVENFSKIKMRINWEEYRKEIDKCILLCANCHAEIHQSDSYEKLKEFEQKYRSIIAAGKGNKTNQEKEDRRKVYICEHCGKEFRLSFPSSRKKKFCSRQCYLDKNSNKHNVCH